MGPGLFDTTSAGDWLDSGDGSDLYIQCVTSDSLSGDLSDGSWLSLTTNRQWYIFDNSADDGAVTASFTLNIATDSGGSNIIDTQTFTPTASFITL